MNTEDQLKLSFYKEISKLGDSQNVSLVERIDTNEIFVKKEYEGCDTRVFDVIKESGFSGIPRIIECVRDTESNRTTIIEEHINGKTLRTILDMEGTLPADTVISISVSICDILRPLHLNEPPIIHRDIKPDNVIISEDGKVHIVDFDASKLYNKGSHRDTELLGTETYAAPEQYGFLQSDQRTDIYAIGVLIREMSTGSTEAHDGAVSPFESIIGKCTHMNPDDRYQNVIDLKYALLQALPPYTDTTEADLSFSFALPGYRSDSIAKKIIATSLYLLAFYSSFTYVEDGLSTVALWINRIMIFITMMAITLLFGNYLGICSKLPLTRSSSKFIRVIGYVLYTFLILLIFGSITSITDRIF